MTERTSTTCLPSLANARQSTLVALLASAFVIAGCASQSPRVSASDAVVPGEAYLYGRFSITTSGGAAGQVNVGLSIECKDGARHTFLFSSTEPLYAVRISPAECQFKEFLFLGTGSYVESTRPAPKELSKPRRLLAGKSYYLGDFTATAVHTQRTFGTSIYWRASPPVDKFTETRKAFVAAFPRLADLPTENATGLGYGDPLLLTKAPMRSPG